MPNPTHNAILQVTVIGAGTMGAAIAGHIANAGLPVTLLDVAPTELTPQEAAAGLALDSPAVRNRIVRAGFARMLRAKPDNLFAPSVAARIRLGNLDDDFAHAVGEADWIIEAIVERPAPKQTLLARIEDCAKPDAIVSTNTSGIPIGLLAAGRSQAFQRRFLGAHFFNPPRYLRLLELIPGAQTDPAVIAQLASFAENTLGKGVVLGKDTPTFIANRLFTFIQSDLVEFAAANRYSVNEVDMLTGPLIGRPKTATFRLLDIVGIDLMSLIAENLYPLILHDEGRAALHGAHLSAILRTLLEQNLLGSKSGQGFYKLVADAPGGKAFWGLDLQDAARGVITYREPQVPAWPSVAAAARLPLPARLAALFAADDGAGRLIRHTLLHTLAYASLRIPEIADSIADVDHAMRWGFAWELGPFETWDALGLRPVLAAMDAENIAVAPWVRALADAGRDSFYQQQGAQRLAYCPADGAYHAVEGDSLAVHLPALRAAGRTLAENESASLLDLGDGVILLEFHSKMNTLDEGIMHLAQDAAERLHGNAVALVIGNQGVTFSAGANLKLFLQAADAGQWRRLEEFVRLGQEVMLALRAAPRPVVAAPFQRALGGGLEICLTAARIVAHAEAYVGLVEAGVGIIPAWGGCKEMLRRNLSPHMHAAHANPAPYLRQIFETVGFAQVSASALHAQELGCLSPHDRIVMNADRLLAEAKREALHLADGGYLPSAITGTVYAAGRDALANLRVEIYSLCQAGRISDYDAHIAGKLAYVLCGGDLSRPAWMDERYFLDLEREAFLSLAGEQKTQDRIRHMLQNGKPLRN